MSAQNDKPNSEHLLQISDEVSRIATALAHLSAASVPFDSPILSNSEGLEISVKTVRAVIRARRLRDRYFDGKMFADPAWEMMLRLFEAELSHRRVAVLALSKSAGVPPTTAVRWINTLVEQALFTRRADPLDGRRIYIELSKATSDAMRRYFKELESDADI